MSVPVLAAGAGVTPWSALHFLRVKGTPLPFNGAGVAATVTMAVLGSLSRRVGLAPGAKGQRVGRWYLGMVRGRFAHSSIDATPEQPVEARAALVGHSLIGVLLAVLYVLGAG